MRVATGLLMAMLGLACCGGRASGQEAAEASHVGDVTETFFLNNTSSNNGEDTRQIYSALQMTLSHDARVTYVPIRNAILVRGTQQQVDMARKLLKDLDRGGRAYRLTYTITEFDGTKHVGTQHFSMVAVTGQRTTMKQGSKIPVVTGTSGQGSGTQTQVTYLDVGLNFDVSLDESSAGFRLRSKEEQSGIAEQPSGLGGQDPVVRQTVLEGTSILAPGKPLVLGSLDIPGTTRRQDVEVVMEIVP